MCNHSGWRSPQRAVEILYCDTILPLAGRDVFWYVRPVYEGGRWRRQAEPAMWKGGWTESWLSLLRGSSLKNICRAKVHFIKTTLLEFLLRKQKQCFRNTDKIKLNKDFYPPTRPLSVVQLGKWEKKLMEAIILFFNSNAHYWQHILYSGFGKLSQTHLLIPGEKNYTDQRRKRFQI